MDSKYQEKAINHFRLKIVDAKLAYSLFRYLRVCEGDEEMLSNINSVRSNYNNFFNQIESSLVSSFILKLLHAFDLSSNKQSLSLYDIDNAKVEVFVKKHEVFLKSLKDIRDKQICHYDKKQLDTINLNFNETDLFFADLEIFYNSLTKEIESSVTLFSQDLHLKHELGLIIERLNTK